MYAESGLYRECRTRCLVPVTFVKGEIFSNLLWYFSFGRGSVCHFQEFDVVMVSAKMCQTTFFLFKCMP